MTGSLIAPGDVYAIAAIFFALVVLCLRLEKTGVGKRVSAAMMTVFGAMALSNLGVLPKAAPFYDLIWTYLVPLAIALFLIKADLISIVSEGRRVLVAFLLGAAGAFVGAVLAAWLLDLGRDGASYAAVLTATYTGGSLNFAAVAKTIDFRDPTKLAAAVTIDNVLGVSFIIFVGLTASWPIFRRTFGWRADALLAHDPTATAADGQGAGINDMVLVLALAAAACALGNYVAGLFGWGSYAILFITLIMVAVATVGRRQLAGIRGEEMLAMIFMYLFFAMLGTGVDLFSLVNAAPPLFVMVASIFLFHSLFLLVGGYLLRLNYAELIIASMACIGGPPIASALAILFGWHRLAIPGVVTGIFGYVIGTFLGVGMFNMLQ